MVAVTALVAVLLAAIDREPTREQGGSGPLRDPTRRPTLAGAISARAGTILAAAIAAAFLALSIDVDLSPRLQRGNWRGVARALGPARGSRVITTVELGSAPLEYYLPPLRNLARGASVTVTEIDEIGYSPLRRGAGRPPAPGFRLREHLNIDGLRVYRFISPVPRAVPEVTLRRHVITLAHPEVLVAAGAKVSRGPVPASPGRTQPASSAQNT